MIVTFQAYSVDQFNALNYFNDALQKFHNINGDNLVKGLLKDLFRDYGVDRTFGLALLHKHDALRKGERMTDIRGTSSPLSFELGQPSIWALQPGSAGLTPLEFSVEATEIDWTAPHVQNFLHAFGRKVAELNAQDIFGLCAYPGDDYAGCVETTVGRANINLTPEEAKAIPSGTTSEARWFYSDPLINRGCKCNCLNTKEHAHSHGYTT